MSANEHKPRLALLARLPLALQISIKNHMHALKNKTLRLLLESNDALAAQNIRAVTLNQLVEPGNKAFGIDITLVTDR